MKISPLAFGSANEDYAMTWIVAKTFLSGYAAMFSDVQVTWRKGGRAHREDCLRKVYAIAPNMACGFSGSVEVGFNLLTDMWHFAEHITAKEPILLPRKFALEWYRRGRYIFSRLEEKHQKLGCSLILAGSSPRETHGTNSDLCRTDIIRMRSGNGFTPEIHNGRRAISIGSGSTKDRYVRFLNGISDTNNTVAIESSDIQPGMAGENVAFLASIMLRDNVEAGVSSHVHCTLIHPHHVRSFPLDFSTYEDDGKVSHEMPKVAESYDAFKAFEKRTVGATAEAIG